MEGNITIPKTGKYPTDHQLGIVLMHQYVTLTVLVQKEVVMS